MCEAAEFIVERRDDGKTISKNLGNLGTQWWPTVKEAYEYHVRVELSGNAPDLSEYEDEISGGSGQRLGSSPSGAKRRRADSPNVDIWDDTSASLATLQKEVVLHMKKSKLANSIAGEHGVAVNKQAKELLASRRDTLADFFTDSDDEIGGSTDNDRKQKQERLLVAIDVKASDYSNGSPTSTPSDPLDTWGNAAAVSDNCSFSLRVKGLADRDCYRLTGIHHFRLFTSTSFGNFPKLCVLHR